MLSNSFRNLFGFGQSKHTKKPRRNKDGVVVDGADYATTRNELFNNKLGDRKPQISYKGVNLRGRVLEPKPKTLVSLKLCNGPVVIKGKCKKIVLDGCYDITVTFEEAIDGVTCTKCDSVALTGYSRKIKFDNSKDCNIGMPEGAVTVKPTKEKPININYFKSTGAVTIAGSELQEVTEKGDVTLSYADGEFEVVRKEAHPRLGSSRLRSWRDSWAAFLGGGTLRGSKPKIPEDKGNGV